MKCKRCMDDETLEGYPNPDCPVCNGTGKQPDKCTECPDYMISSENCYECHKEEVLKPCKCGDLSDGGVRSGWLKDNSHHIVCINCDSNVSGETIRETENKWNRRNK